MPLESFTTSESLTVGVELELQLVNLTSFDLTSASTDMLHLLRRAPFPGNVTPEITESMIEICTDVQRNYDGILNQLRDIRDKLVLAGDRLNVGVCGGGSHPFQRWFERQIFPKPRFKEVSILYGYLAKQFTVYGQHVHIGCRSGDEALYLLHALNRYVPHFIALSASSPYFQGVDTLFNSSRLNTVYAFPLSGTAPFILNWDEFTSDYFAKMEHTGVVNSMKDFYWDIRPKPEYGTIELRVCDTPLTVEKAAALACYLQALCKYLLDGNEPPPERDDYLVYTYNRFQACRFGLEGTLVHPRSKETLSLREDVLTTLRHIEPYFKDLASLGAAEHLIAMTHDGSDARYLRGQYEMQNSLEGVVDAALGKFRGRVKDGCPGQARA
ncbi:YbdK family carboxylate-amine ligase [Govanella unica]|uniref:Putative glutamate--cysteine ligase 2 n=1 Tax=Govanella unica TaxID=2975056 RepID=A0A9X3Z6W9_9PROT|nr:YbdK family carboxylate-amine ligase [Govania unica]